jgi:mycothiol system anti-sigma-R factor
MYEYLDGELTPDTLKRIKAHISACEHCFSKFEFEKHLHQSISDKGQIEVNAEPLKQKVLRGIRELDMEDEREGFFFFGIDRIWRPPRLPF